MLNSLYVLTFMLLLPTTFSTVRAVNVIDPQDPTRPVVALIRCEKEVTDNCLTAMPFNDRRPITDDLIARVTNGTPFDNNAGAHADLSGLNLSEMTSGLIWIQSKKLRHRHTTIAGSTYTTNFDFHLLDNLNQFLAVGERWADPYPIDFTLGNERHRLISHWNGNATQPGNCVLRRSHVRQQNQWVSAVDFINYRHTAANPNPITANLYNSQPYQLVLAMEIARRKAINPVNSQPDAFSTLPVTLGVVMMPTLLQHDNQNVRRFWINNSDYHIFTGTAQVRMTHFDALINRYRQIYGIANDLNAIMGQINHDAYGVLGYQDDDFNAAFGNLGI